MGNRHKLGLMGASGRLGRAIALLALQDPCFRLTAALVHPASKHLGLDLGPLLGKEPLGLPLLSQGHSPFVDVYIDVSLPEGLAARIELALKRKTPLVIGTTGLSASDLALVDKASAQIPILQTSNFSLGMTLMQKLAKEAAIAFHADADIELVETHHTEKKDAPSGSAKMLAETVADAHPLKKKPSIRSVRLGKVVGEHVLSFLAPEEQIVLSHTAHSRDVFARGALAAARFLKEQLPGRYQMSDLIA